MEISEMADFDQFKTTDQFKKVFKVFKIDSLKQPKRCSLVDIQPMKSNIFDVFMLFFVFIWRHQNSKI